MKEQNALIVLNVHYGKQGNLTGASVNLEIQSDKTATLDGSARAIKPGVDGNHYPTTADGGLVIGGFHTHPAAGATVGGNTYFDDPAQQKTDIANFTRSTSPQNYPEYAIDSKSIDKTTPNSTAGGQPTFQNDYAPANSGFNIGRDALKTFGSK